MANQKKEKKDDEEEIWKWGLKLRLCHSHKMEGGKKASVHEFREGEGSIRLEWRYETR